MLEEYLEHSAALSTLFQLITATHDAVTQRTRVPRYPVVRSASHLK